MIAGITMQHPLRNDSRLTCCAVGGALAGAAPSFSGVAIMRAAERGRLQLIELALLPGSSLPAFMARGGREGRREQQPPVGILPVYEYGGAQQNLVSPRIW